MADARQFLAIALSLVVAQPARGQAPAGTEQVVVRVTVKDAAGNLVDDVTQKEFRILEDGVEQEIAQFSVEACPLSAVVLIDSALAAKTAEQVEQSAGAIAAGFSEFDEVAIARFETQFELVSEFTSDNDALHRQLKRLSLGTRVGGLGGGPMTAGPRINAGQVGPQVGSNLPRAETRTKNIDDAVYAAVRRLGGRDPNRRKIILLVSDGANSRNNSITFDTARKLLLVADVAVYAVAIGVRRLDRGVNVLERYTYATGGGLFYASNRAELESAYARVTEQARNPYTLAYVPRNTDRRTGYHDLEVRVRRSNLQVLARQGYFLEPKS